MTYLPRHGRQSVHSIPHYDEECKTRKHLRNFFDANRKPMANEHDRKFTDRYFTTLLTALVICTAMHSATSHGQPQATHHIGITGDGYDKEVIYQDKILRYGSFSEGNYEFLKNPGNDSGAGEIPIWQINIGAEQQDESDVDVSQEETLSNKHKELLDQIDRSRLEEFVRDRKSEGYQLNVESEDITMRRAMAPEYDGASVAAQLSRSQLIPKADNGDVSSQRRLAEMYRYGLGGVTNVDESIYYYNMASESGDVEAKLALVDILTYTQGDIKNSQEIEILLQEAADSGLPLAQVKLGSWLQLQGDHEAALYWYTQAAEQEDLDGIYRLGSAHYDGIGTEQNFEEARKILAVAASGQYAPAETLLAEMLLEGQGGLPEERQAVQLLERASRKDFGPALLASARLYNVGRIVQRDLEEAYKRVRRAAELGEKEAIDMEEEILYDYCESMTDNCVTVPILYMTDRKDTGNEELDQRFANQREDQWRDSMVGNSNLHYGVVTTTVPAAAGTKPEQIGVFKKAWRWLWKRITGSTPHDTTIVRSLEPLSESDFGTILKEFSEIRDSQRIMVFVHGFNNSFSFAARRFAEFTNHISFDGIPIMFSWPSYNRLLLYGGDLNQVERSCPRFSSALDKVKIAAQESRVDVMAHSMGAKLLFDSITGGKGGKCESPNVSLYDVVLAAPDIDKQLFLENVGEFARRANSVTLYASSNDAALYASSSLVWVGEHRLGQGGEKLSVDKNMYSIDASEIEKEGSEDAVRHAYVFTNDMVVRDVYELLMKNMGPEVRSCTVAKRNEDGPFWTFDPHKELVCLSDSIVAEKGTHHVQ